MRGWWRRWFRELWRRLSAPLAQRVSTLVYTLVDGVDGVDATISGFALYDPTQKVADRGLVVFGDRGLERADRPSSQAVPAATGEGQRGAAGIDGNPFPEPSRGHQQR